MQDTFTIQISSKLLQWPAGSRAESVHAWLRRHKRETERANCSQLVSMIWQAGMAGGSGTTDSDLSHVYRCCSTGCMHWCEPVGNQPWLSVQTCKPGSWRRFVPLQWTACMDSRDVDGLHRMCSAALARQRLRPISGACSLCAASPLVAKTMHAKQCWDPPMHTCLPSAQHGLQVFAGDAAIWGTCAGADLYRAYSSICNHAEEACKADPHCHWLDEFETDVRSVV